MAKIAKARKEQNSSYRINKDKLSTFIQYLNATCFKSLHSILNFGISGYFRLVIP